MAFTGHRLGHAWQAVLVCFQVTRITIHCIDGGRLSALDPELPDAASLFSQLAPWTVSLLKCWDYRQTAIAGAEVPTLVLTLV